MALTLISAPAEFLTSKNPVAFVMGKAETDTFTKVTCAVFMETEYGLADWQFVHDESRTFDSDNRAVFQIQTVLDAELEKEAVFLVEDTSIKFDGSLAAYPYSQPKAVRRYVVVFKPDIPEVLDLESYEILVQDKFVLKASLPHSGFTPAGNFYPPEPSDFRTKSLSHKPQTRSFFPGQIEVAWFSGPKPQNNILQWKWGTISGVLETEQGTVQHDGNGIKTNLWLKHLPYGIAVHKVMNYALATQPSIDGIYIEFFGEKLRYLRAFEELEYVREFHFSNSLGGFDSLITYGKATPKETISFDESQKFLPHNYQATDFQFARHNVTGRTEIKLGAGYRSEAERDAAKALLYSEQAYERKNGKILPIVILPKSIKNNPDGDFRFGLEFEYEYAFEQYQTI
jgi:hypothetical protein